MWDGKWYYPYLSEAIEEAGFEEICKSITRRQNTVAHYIDTRPILDVPAVVGPERNRFKDGKGTGGGGPSDGLRVGIGSRIGSGGRGRGGAGGERGGEKHIQWSERITCIGMERHKCQPLGMIIQDSAIIHNARAW